MRRIQIALVVALLASCGGEAPKGDGGRQSRVPDEEMPENRPPEIIEAYLAPDEPSRDDTIRLILGVRDPDRDGLDIQITWRRNGLVYLSGPDQSIPSGRFSSGDEIEAVVLVSDGEFEDLVETYPVTIRNLPPRVTFVRLKPQPVRATDNLLADVEADDPEGDEVTFEYRWIVNGEELKDATGPVLEAGTLHRGDEVQVQVGPIDDGEHAGHTVLSAPVRVENSSPEIQSRPPFELESTDTYVYNIVASDPDGDGPLRFELGEGPPGMRVDIVNGKLTWRIPPDAVGTHDVEILVRDGYGGEAKQRYQLKIQFESPPASREE